MMLRVNRPKQVVPIRNGNAIYGVYAPVRPSHTEWFCGKECNNNLSYLPKLGLGNSEGRK